MSYDIFAICQERLEHDKNGEMFANLGTEIFVPDSLNKIIKFND